MSSPFQIRPSLDRKRLDFTNDCLKSFFGLSYFQVKVGADKPIEKIVWLYGLLSNYEKLACFEALYDIAKLIEYSYTLPKSIQKTLQNLKKNPQNLRTFFFELFIYRFLDENKITNEKKAQEGIQELEGLLDFGGLKFLFECRKVFIPKLKEVDLLRRVMTDLTLQAKTMKAGYGMIVSITLSRPIEGAHYNSFKNKIRTFFDRFNKSSGIKGIDYVVSDKFGEFKVENYSEATLVTLTELNKPDVLFYLKPLEFILPGVKAYYQAKSICNFSIFRYKIYEKLEEVLKEKKKQHKGSTYKQKVIFIDSEILPEFQWDLFAGPESYDPESIRRICQKLQLNAIVFIIKRTYTPNGPHVSADYYTSEEMMPIAERIKYLMEQ